MISFNDSIDTKIFMSLQISKTCKEKLGENRPVLFLSNPGIGKSTAVSYFAKINDYDVVLLRISNETPDTLTGYDAVGTVKEGKNNSASHVRPSWYQRILDNKEKGIKSLLFLDEITTADGYVQGAALNIVFDRKCKEEYLPDDTLIVSAGNYAGNLSSEMEVLAPMLNRFILVNIKPQMKDLKHFFCRYSGSAIGKRIDLGEEITKAMVALKEQEIRVPDKSYVDKIGEILEEAIRTETEVICNEGVLELPVSDLKNVYSDVDNARPDDPVPNFFSFRSGNFLVDAAVSCYLCFGKAGLLSDNFKAMIHGTVGLALSRDKNGELKRTIVTDRYYSAISDAADDIERLNNNKIPEYNEFFSSILGSVVAAGKMSVADMNLITKKIQEIEFDQEVANIDRPIQEEFIQNIMDNLVTSLQKNYRYTNLNFTSADQLNEVVKENPDRYVEYINVWNTARDLIQEVKSIVNRPERKYNQEIKKNVSDAIKECSDTYQQLKIIRRIIQKTNPDMVNMIPQLNTL